MRYIIIKLCYTQKSEKEKKQAKEGKYFKKQKPTAKIFSWKDKNL